MESWETIIDGSFMWIFYIRLSKREYFTTLIEKRWWNNFLSYLKIRWDFNEKFETFYITSSNCSNEFC